MYNFGVSTSSPTYTTNNPKTLIIIAVIFLAAGALFVGLYIRRREIVFEGVVIDKDIIESQVQNNNMNSPGIMLGNSGGVTHTYRIKVKTDAGKDINYKISEGKYEIIKIGDRVSKAKGSTEINITPQAQSASQPSRPPTEPPITTPPVTPTAGTFV